MEAFRILQWDSDFFGFTVAQISISELNAGQLEAVLSELRRSNVRLAYWPTARAEPGIDPDFIKGFGGRLVDEKTTFLVDMESLASPVKNNVRGDFVVEEYNASMSRADLRALAIQSGAYSRFALDPNIPRAKFEEMYRIWMDKSLAKEMAAEVLVIRNEDGRVVGMATLGSKGERGDIGLLAVDAKFRGRQLGEKLVRHAQEWFLTHGYRFGQVVTQGANTPACRLYAKCGYSVEKVEHYYHFWL